MRERLNCGRDLCSAFVLCDLFVDTRLGLESGPCAPEQVC